MNDQPGTTTQQCAYDRGRQACAEGKAVDANPHRKNTVAHDWWIRGWKAAGGAA